MRGWTDEELIAVRDTLRGELKRVVDELHARRRKAIKETLRLASLSSEEAGARIRQPESDDLEF